MNLRPLITICGTTGVGKSNLAIELATRICQGSLKTGWKGAKIINADSMQVYAGLDILTNKVPEDKRKGIEHFLMGFKQPGEQYVVGEWVQDALKLINDMHEQNELPIVVGGTSYWIQHLIFPNRLTPCNPLTFDRDKDLLEAIANLPSQTSILFDSLPNEPPSAKIDPDAAYHLHMLLSALDPPMAARWHWRDTRKVLRSLQIIKSSRQRASDIVNDQSQNTLGNKPRFRTLCFWVYSDLDKLKGRLDSRVDDMVQRGLLDEIRALQSSSQTSKNMSPPPVNDYSTGIFQSIGYKVFAEHLSPYNSHISTFGDAVERMKLSTRQYAKRQISWIRNKLLPAVDIANAEEDGVVAMYVLDASDIEIYWVRNVQDPALQILEAFLNNKNLPNPYSLSDTAEKALRCNTHFIDPKATIQTRRKVTCEVCTIRSDRPIVIEEGGEWETHIRTRVHRRLAIKKSRSLDQHQEFIQ